MRHPNQTTTAQPPIAIGALATVMMMFVLGSVTTSQTQADVLKLRSGGQVDGILLNPEEEPRTKYVMQLETGGSITFTAAEVRSYLPLTDAQKKYREHLARMKPTANHNWQLAKWCKSNGLRNERTFHLEAAIQLEPDHKEARSALGYTLRNGEWKHSEDFLRERREFMERRGYKLHAGRWRLPQDIELDKRKQENELAEKKWARDLKRWRSYLDKERKREEAVASIKAINDYRAAPALAKALKDESVFVVAKMYVQVLSKLRSQVAAKALVTVVLTPTSLDLRDEALDGLTEYGREAAVNTFIGALSSKDSATVKRAGFGLQRLVDPRATRPLIEALVTEHKTTSGGGNPGQLSTSFGGGANGNGIGFGAGSRPTTKIKTERNSEVLEALLLLSDGANFDYNEEQWLKWLSLRETPQPDLVDLRRGP